MSTIATTDAASYPAAEAAIEPKAKRLRVWPAVAIVLFVWAALYANHTLEMTAGIRFMSRMGSMALALLAFLVWWLSRSAVLWRDRLLAIAVTIALGATTLQVADPSIKAFGLVLSSFPIIVTVWTAWVAIARSFTRPVQRIGFCAAIALAFAYFALVRFDGLLASQQAEFSWRWTPTKEQQFLAGRGDTEKAKPAGKPWSVQPTDWPEFRGPNRDGALPGVTIAADWAEHPPKQLWRKTVGPGWSGMIVVDSHLVTQEQRGEVESVVSYDAASGAEQWAHNDKKRFQEDLAGAGPRGTPTFAGGRIYALGAKGTLNCLMPETGDVVWSHDVVKDAAVTLADRPVWGYSVSPLVVDGLVVVFAGGATDKSVLAYHAADGKLAWSHAAGKQSYSSPQLATLGGQKQVVMHDIGAIRGLAVGDGRELWSYPNGSEIAFPMIQPHVLGANELVVSITPGIARLEVKQDGDKWSATDRWTSNVLRPDFSDFVIHKGCVYGLNDGVLCCLDVESGAKIWKKSRLGQGQILLLPEQDAILVSTEPGEVVLLSVSREGPKELGRFKAIEGKTWNGPVVVGNRLYLRNAVEMAAYEFSVQQSPSQSQASSLQTSSP